VSSTTPSWLLEREVGLCPCGCIGRRRKGSFVAKTLDGGARVMREALFAEDTAARDGLLQRLDPRVKVVTTLGSLVVVSLLRSLPVLIAAYGATLVLAVLSRLPLGVFVKRVWLFIPLFTGVVVLPATLNVITDGDIVVPLGTWFGHELGVTTQGLTGAAVLVTRVTASISLVVLLTLTTSWTRLLAALRALFVPRLFILVLGMAYRYLFLLLSSVTDMYTARRARTVSDDHARDVRAGAGRRFVAASAGALFGRTHALSEEVHMAMVSRGYTGDARSLTSFRVRVIDGVWIVCVVVAAILFLGAGRGT
jgi:cobalt ECF transporter T component CbiQ